MRRSVRIPRRTRGRAATVGLAGAVALAMPGIAAGHELDHPAPAFSRDAPLTTTILSGGSGGAARWELVTSIPTGNPHTDLDFFTSGGEKYATVGTLAAGPNAGGQTIVQLTKDGVVDPAFLSAHPSAFCASNPRSLLGLQHDVEATPKGAVINNSSQFPSVAVDAQLIVDASDAGGRCHDQGSIVSGVPRGGLEIVDITDVENPVEIGLTSHIGESHTVNIDPRRPHIAYSVTSDAINVRREDPNKTPQDFSDDEFVRTNEESGFALDGFEVVDMSSCMAPPYGTLEVDPTLSTEDQIAAKREQCEPVTYRYRYPDVEMALGHAAEEQTTGTDPTTGEQRLAQIYGCHELEIYPDDRLTCGGGAAMIMLDMSGAFVKDSTTGLDKPKGTPLPCLRRESSSTLTPTGAMVMDCVAGGSDGKQALTVSAYPEGNTSLEGVEWLGTAYHQGRGAGQFNVNEDIDFNHESELTLSGKNVIATDERGGGVVPPGATCDARSVNNDGNGGVHAYQVDELKKVRPTDPDVAFESYARGTDGKKAIFRAPIRTGAEATFCTAHVMQQVPGQNRVFMGWYTQGTQVVDYVELPGGKFEWVEDQAAQEEGEGRSAQAKTSQAGFFIPQNANTWVSHVFDVQENEDGTFTYFGATGDFLLGEDGRNTIDIYKVTLPAPANACTLAPDSTVTDRGDAAEVHQDAIDCILHYGISKGATGGTTYEPLENVTREQMASFVVNEIKAAGAGDKLPAGGADTFTDIGTSFHRVAINQLQRAGIIRGIGGGEFNPKAQISRQQMAAFMVNAARFVTGEAYEPSSLSNFSDVPADNIHARNINAGFEAGLFRGTVAPTAGKPGVYAPLVDVRRDQMATFLRNLFLQTIQP